MIFVPLDLEMPSEKEDFRNVIDKDIAIEIFLNTLEDREKLVIELFFFENKNLQECGKELKLSRERIRQIKFKALRKLRHPSRLQILADYGIFEAEEAILRFEKIRIEKEKKIEEEYKLYTKKRNDRIKWEREQRQKVKNELEQRKRERDEYLEKQQKEYEKSVEKFLLYKEKYEKENPYYDFHPGSFTIHRCKYIPKKPPWFIQLNSLKTGLISIHPAVSINRVLGDLVYDQWFKYLMENS